MLEINPNTFAAPRERPAGMDPKVPYQPVLELRNHAFDWLQRIAIQAYYDSGASKIPHKVADWRYREQPRPVLGTPGTPLPDAPGAYRVAVIGDMGEGSPAQARNTAQITRWHPTHVATVGDNVYPLGRERDWVSRFDREYNDLRMSTTWQPALGNHDYYAGNLTPYFSRFPQLQGHAYYTWSLGPAQFFVLDTEQRLDRTSAQNAWLAAELAESTAPYKVIQMHRPMISARGGEIGRSLYRSLGPLMAKYGVQLVLAGHEHGYERSLPIDGTTFMVVGGGGAATHGFDAPVRAPWAVLSGRHHHLELSYDAARMVVRAVDDRGAAFDTTFVLPHAAASGAAAGAAALTTAPAAMW